MADDGVEARIERLIELLPAPAVGVLGRYLDVFARCRELGGQVLAGDLGRVEAMREIDLLAGGLVAWHDQVMAELDEEIRRQAAEGDERP